MTSDASAPTGQNDVAAYTWILTDEINTDIERRELDLDAYKPGTYTIMRRGF